MGRLSSKYTTNRLDAPHQDRLAPPVNSVEKLDPGPVGRLRASYSLDRCHGTAAVKDRAAVVREARPPKPSSAATSRPAIDCEPLGSQDHGDRSAIPRRIGGDACFATGYFGLRYLVPGYRPQLATRGDRARAVAAAVATLAAALIKAA